MKKQKNNLKIHAKNNWQQFKKLIKKKLKKLEKNATIEAPPNSMELNKEDFFVTIEYHATNQVLTLLMFVDVCQGLYILKRRFNLLTFSV